MMKGEDILPQKNPLGTSIQGSNQENHNHSEEAGCQGQKFYLWGSSEADRADLHRTLDQRQCTVQGLFRYTFCIWSLRMYAVAKMKHLSKHFGQRSRIRCGRSYKSEVCFFYTRAKGGHIPQDQIEDVGISVQGFQAGLQPGGLFCLGLWYSL